MTTETDLHRQAFKEEAYELLTELETSLLEWEERPDDGELVGRIFRAMHTIKGSRGHVRALMISPTLPTRSRPCWIWSGTAEWRPPPG